LIYAVGTKLACLFDTCPSGVKDSFELCKKNSATDKNPNRHMPWPKHASSIVVSLKLNIYSTSWPELRHPFDPPSHVNVSPVNSLMHRDCMHKTRQKRDGGKLHKYSVTLNIRDFDKEEQIWLVTSYAHLRNDMYGIQLATIGSELILTY
jgi:hypothetical protein